MSTILVAVVLAVLGAALCFSGYRLFLAFLPILGFFVGFWLGGWVAHQFSGAGTAGTLGGLLAGLVLGIGLATLSHFVVTAGVALVAGGFTAALVSGLLDALGFDPGWFVAIVPIVAGIVMAILTPLLSLQKYLVILLTALVGADALVVAALLFLKGVTLLELRVGGNMFRPLIQGTNLSLYVGLGLTIVGMLVQTATTRHFTYDRGNLVEKVR